MSWPHQRIVGIVRRELGPVAGSREISDGLGAETEDGEVKLSIRKNRTGVRQIRGRPLFEDASKHWELTSAAVVW